MVIISKTNEGTCSTYASVSSRHMLSAGYRMWLVMVCVCVSLCVMEDEGGRASNFLHFLPPPSPSLSLCPPVCLCLLSADIL